MLICRAEYAQKCIDVGEMVVHTFKTVGLVVKFRETVTGAVYDTEDLRERDQEVENLWEEEKELCLREMTEDGDHGKSHSCEVAKSVTNENFGGKFIVLD